MKINKKSTIYDHYTHCDPREAGAKQSPVVQEAVETLVKLLYPFAPHVAEEMWERLGHAEMLARTRWPEYDPALVAEKEVTLVLQVNGKVRSKITVPADTDEATLRAKALADPVIRKWTDGKLPRNVILVPGRLVNIVV